MGGVARLWRRITGMGDADLVPQVRLSGPMPWVIAIMVALTTIAVAAGLALRNTATSAEAELEGGVTVQIVEAAPERRAAQARAALAFLRDSPQVRSARLVPQDEVDRLVEPWLGSGSLEGANAAVPIPALIDARLGGRVSARVLQDLQEELAQIAPAARVDAQSSWLDPVFGAIESLQWLAIALVVLLALALAATVLLAARTALGQSRDTIEIVHLLGGTDSQIARVFQRAAGWDAAFGGLIGLGFAAVAIVVLGRRFAGLGAGMVSNGALSLFDWLLLALVPLAAIVLAMVTARIAVVRTLRKML